MAREGSRLRRVRSSMARLLQRAIGGDYADEHTSESKNRSNAEPRDKTVVHPRSRDRPRPPEGAGQDTEAAQREREKRIERFRER